MTQSKGKTKRVQGRPAAPAVQGGVRMVRVDAEGAGQRIDNLLLRELKGVPRSRVYSMLRKGEVRVDGKRVRPGHRLEPGAQVRLPPWRGTPPRGQPVPPSESLRRRLEAGVIYEDADILVVDKPAGLAVHGGSGVHLGMVEALRALRPDLAFLELAHRIDRDTSGCVLLAKRRAVLRHLHAALRERKAEKRYLALVEGAWPVALDRLDAPLERRLAPSGERFVRVSAAGKPATTRVRVRRRLDGATLLEVRPETGRTHQIRVHLAAAGHPILGDPKYADAAARERHASLGAGRLCLHAAAIEIPDWTGGGVMRGFEAPLPEDMSRIIEALASD